jgi:5-methylcytosine-specific restriction endonuclease McrA
MYAYRTNKKTRSYHKVQGKLTSCGLTLSSKYTKINSIATDNHKMCKSCVKANTRTPRVKKKSVNKFYQLWEWKKVRYQALLKYEQKCMCCGDHPPFCRLVVDHIKPRSKYPKLELDINNLQILCNSCNMGKVNTDETDFRSELHEKMVEVEDYWKDNL